ncbi:chlorite dismutase family protein [Brachybacterium sp. JHP9]|uniref:Coproheme decarboxylase n=1 Tax=Brachybacterium equifaecis TaxID=2910770 RepID=A0ABT0R0I4_9MICO|nr:hydrogen peroxide-dependent heme synthase [Brachybacterium equifaecis]MCL6422470.1 chlorite dismutase family protein [Brachybacterium equifaecis]
MTQHPHSSPVPEADPPGEGQGAEIIRYTSYTVFTRFAAPGEASPEGAFSREAAAAELERVTAAIEASGVTIRGIYDASVFRADSHLLLWMIAERPEQLQSALRLFERSHISDGLVASWSAVGVHREAEFSRSHAPAFMSPSRTPHEWMTVYPFTRSYEWYLLPEEERREMLREHGMMGREYPDVHAHTVAAFSLGDWEWMLAFEAKELHELVDMMRHLRYSKARLHVRDELPFHVGRRLHATADVIDVLL